MRYVCSTLIACLLFVFAIKDFLHYVNFKVHQDFIEKELCVNRNEPEKACHGKCFLMQRIAESRKSDTPAQPPQITELSKDIYYFSLIPFNLDRMLSPETPSFSYAFSSGFFLTEEIFHPPDLHA